MLVSPNFFVESTCRFCGVNGKQTIIFEQYVPSVHRIAYSVRCSNCIKQARKKGSETYNYVIYETTIEEWNKFVPKIFDSPLN